MALGGDIDQPSVTSSSGISNVVEDTTPQLGGDLDGQSTYDINNVVDIFTTSVYLDNGDAGTGAKLVGGSTPGSNTVTIPNATGTVLLNISEDTSPQLGGNLDANGKLIDLNGLADGLVLDTDGDTTISAPTDDQIDIEIAGADDFRFTANTFTALSGSTIATNTIAETTAASGVTIDGLLIKDGLIAQANSIDSDAYIDGSIDTDHLADDAVTDAKRPRKSVGVFTDTGADAVATSYTILPLDTETLDTQSQFTLSANKVTIGEAGLYHIIYEAVWTGFADNEGGSFKIVKNSGGTPADLSLEGEITGANNVDDYKTITCTVVLSASDTIEAQATVDSGDTGNVGQRQLTIIKLSD